MRSLMLALAVWVGLCLSSQSYAQHCGLDTQVIKQVAEWRGERAGTGIDDVLQYAPLAMNLGLGLVGAEAQNGIRERLVESVEGYLVFASSAFILKHIVDSPRPDGSGNDSFPSGHAGVSFLGAELVRMEYGWGWGAGAYALAGTVSYLRLYNNEHWLTDVLAGAGMGVLCAHIGAWLSRPTMNLLGIGKTLPEGLSVAPSIDPMSGALCTSLSIRF